MAQAVAHAEGQQHPIRLYLVVWGWLFILSTCSYLVDYFHLQGYLRWSLILLFMIVKAGLIVAVFMHMAWERLALVYAILVPPVAVLVFVAIMVFESDYTLFTRLAFFRDGIARVNRDRWLAPAETTGGGARVRPQLVHSDRRHHRGDHPRLGAFRTLQRRGRAGAQSRDPARDDTVT